jgi:uncharacterized integral membrane protein
MSTPGQFDPAQPNPPPYGGAGDSTPAGGTSQGLPDQYTEPVAIGGVPVVAGEPSGPPAEQQPATSAPNPLPRKHSRTGAAWVALVVAAVVLIFLLIFVVQNPEPVQVRYFGFEGTLSLGVAMLFAALAGALTAGLLGTVRILQLRTRARRAGK